MNTQSFLEAFKTVCDRNHCSLDLPYTFCPTCTSTGRPDPNYTTLAIETRSGVTIRQVMTIEFAFDVNCLDSHTCGQVQQRVANGRRRPFKDYRIGCANTTCDVNGVRNETKRCGKCNSVYYCSRACQRLHWSSHKTICK
jgi:hypothetical protein